MADWLREYYTFKGSVEFYLNVIKRYTPRIYLPPP